MTGYEDTTGAWTKVWLDAQKQYLDTWMQLSQGDKNWAGSQAPFTWGGASPWTQPMQQWARLMTQALPRESQDASTRLFDLSKSYMNMGETFWRLLQQGKAIAGGETNWQEAMKNALSAAGGSFDLTGQGSDPWSSFATIWGLPLNTWQHFTSSFSPFLGEMDKALRPEGVSAPSDMTKAMRQMLSVPPVGYTREWQEQAQQWTQLYLEYAKAMQDFARLLGKVVQRAAELFSQKLAGLFNESKSLEGLRAAYNLWIDCGEEAYAEVVATPDFPHLQAQMVNALMRLKRHEQVMFDEMMTALHMPSRCEMDTTHKRVHELKQQLRTLQDAMENLAPPKVLRDEPRAAAVKREAPVKKKTAAKPPRSQSKRRAQPKTKKG